MFVAAGRVNYHRNALFNSAFHVHVIYAVNSFEARENFVVHDTLQCRNVSFPADAQPHDGENIRGQPQDERVAGLFT